MIDSKMNLGLCAIRLLFRRIRRQRFEIVIQKIWNSKTSLNSEWIINLPGMMGLHSPNLTRYLHKHEEPTSSSSQAGSLVQALFLIFQIFWEQQRARKIRINMIPTFTRTSNNKQISY